MPGGLSGLSQWRGDYVFPKKRPVWATWYVLRRYVLPRVFSLANNELPPTGAADTHNLADFDKYVSVLTKNSGLKHPGILFLYPTKKDLLMARHSTEWLPERKDLEDISAKYGVTLVDVAQNAGWTESLYRDGTHPTVEGNVVLAKIISDAVRDTLAAGAL
jgi:lysophospholipase L1-like esterase